MKEIIERILPLWGVEARQLSQIYSSAWEVDHSYVMKAYRDRDQLERNLRISEILSECHIPVAEVVPARTGEKYVAEENGYFFLSQKLQGSNITDIKDRAMARKMGCAMARLHRAFRECEKEIAFWDNSLRAVMLLPPTNLSKPKDSYSEMAAVWEGTWKTWWKG